MRRSCLLLIAASFLLPMVSAQVITTVAGSQWVFRGDGGRAVDAALGRTSRIAVDAIGNVFVSDEGNQLVVKISSSGILTVVGGNGIGGYSGDGGLATSASMYLPKGVALAPAGNLYITDAQRVREIGLEGIIRTVAGGGKDYSDGIPATLALLNLQDVAVDPAGVLSVATGNQVRKIGRDGIITPVVGTGIAGYSGDGGPATSATLNLPSGLALDAEGNLYIADSLNSRIRKVDGDGIITTVAGGGVYGFSGDGAPAFIEVTDGKVHDVNILDQILPGAGSFYVMDRGYVDFERLYLFQLCAAFFVVRTKLGVRLRRRYSHPVADGTGVLSDHTVVLASYESAKHYPDALRRIRYHDAARDKRLVFLTNNFDLPALTVALLYKSRWNVELFFKWVKQHLRIKAFFGTSQNAVKTQIWIAISVYVLVAILKKRLALEPSLYQILRVLSVTLFEKVPILRAFDEAASQEKSAEFHNQLNLLDL